MCLGSMDLSKVRKVKALLNKAIDDLILNHRDVLCNNPSKDFIRNRDFTPKKIISTLLRYGSSNAESELIENYYFSRKSFLVFRYASFSAFIIVATSHARSFLRTFFFISSTMSLHILSM